MERHIAGTNPATELGIDVIPSSIDPSPDPPNAELPYLGPDNLDVPGPSSTFIPRQPSPPLPDLRSRPFPPNEHSDSEDEDDEDDDEIIAQLPIYLSPALFPNLDLYQYPLQLKSLNAPKWAQERGKAISARVKENAGPVEIEVPVDEDPYYWRDEQARTMGFIPDVHANGDDEQAANFGFAAKADDKKKKKKPEIKREKWGEKRRLRGDLVPSATGYYSGVIHDGALHLHPVSKTLQFRPSLGYLDDLDAVEASKRSRDDGEGGKRKSKRDAPPRPKLVSVVMRCRRGWKADHPKSTTMRITMELALSVTSGTKCGPLHRKKRKMSGSHILGSRET